MRFEGKVALVTGAGRGLGARVVQRLAEEGATVVALDRAWPSDDSGGAALRIDLDVTSETGWVRVVGEATGRFGSADILVNNAGILGRGPMQDCSADDFMAVTRVNQLGMFLGMKAVSAEMRERGAGAIVNVSSAAGLTGSANLVAYTASKWAVRGMTKSAALELAPFGVRVNSVHPGVIDTPMLQVPGEPGRLERLLADVPLRRVASADEIAGPILFLASDDSAYCTGAELAVDGGTTAGARRTPFGELEASSL